MSRSPSRFVRAVNLTALGLIGLLLGYLLVQLWTPESQEQQPTAPVATAAGTDAMDGEQQPLDFGTSPVNSSVDRPAGGSSLSVIGGMSREEQIRRGIIPGDSGPQGQAPPASMPVSSTPAGRTAEAPPATGTPTAARFPDHVQQAASRYLCLCGCPHTLRDCPCNEQPIGAGTMLSYLQQLLEGQKDPEAGMVERYGERVLNLGAVASSSP